MMDAQQKEALLNQLLAERAAAGGAAPGGVPGMAGMGGMTGFGAPSLTSAPTGFLVGLNVPTPAGKVRCFVAFGPEAAANPAVAMAAIQALTAAGWPVDAYVPKQGGAWSGNGGGGGYGRGYGRGGGW